MNALATIADRAASQGLPFLLAGGHAVITHGVLRSTFDLDLIVRREDREQWLEFARLLGYALEREGPAFLQFAPPDPESFPLDLMLVNASTFSKLSAEGVPAPSAVRGVRVVSLLHLLALKCHAVKHGHAGRIVQDAEDVIQWIQKNGLNPEAGELQEIFKKYGTDEFYEKVRKACRGERQP